MFKCPIVNVQVIGQKCGYGEGRTWKEAREDALKVADIHYPGKVLNRTGSGVIEIFLDYCL